MRKSIFFLTLVFLFGVAEAQKNKETKIPMIGDNAPAFTAETTKGTLNFPADYGRNWKIILSHSHDFTTVCTSEILELPYMQKNFRFPFFNSS